MATSEHPDYLSQLMHELSATEFFTVALKKLTEIDVKTTEEVSLLQQVMNESCRMFHDYQLSLLSSEKRATFFEYLERINIKPGVFFRSPTQSKWKPVGRPSSNPYEVPHKVKSTPGRSIEPDYSSGMTPAQARTPGRLVETDYVPSKDSSFLSERTLEQGRTPGRRPQEPDYVPGKHSEKTHAINVRPSSPKKSQERSRELLEHGRSTERYHQSGRSVEGSRIPGRSLEGSRTPGRSLEGSRTPGRSVESSRTPGRSIESSRTPGRSFERSRWSEESDPPTRSIEPRTPGRTFRSDSPERFEEVHQSGWSDGSSGTPERSVVFSSGFDDYPYKAPYSLSKNRSGVKSEPKDTARFGFSFNRRARGRKPGRF